MSSRGLREDFAVGWRGRWLALPIGLFPAAMVGSIGKELLRLDGLPFLALAVALGYLALSLVLNHARFRVGDGYLTVAHRPLPWPGPRVELASVTALEVTGRAGRNDIVGWEIHALLRDGGSIRLLGPPCAGLSHSDLAEPAAELARFLGVPLR